MIAGEQLTMGGSKICMVSSDSITMNAQGFIHQYCADVMKSSPLNVVSKILQGDVLGAFIDKLGRPARKIMSYDYLEVNHLDVFNTFTGGGILFPKAFTEPGGGVLSAYKGHFGQGSSIIPYSASLVSGPSVGAIPTPLSWNFLGLGLETGVRNQLGVDIKIGADISLGAIKAAYSAFFNKVTGKEVAITPKDSL